MIRTASAAFIAAALLLAAAPALAQDGHVNHAAHDAAHAAFASERLSVRVDGPEGAPDLILIPGLSSSPDIWQGTVDHLAGRYRVHRIHVAGFAGAAPRPMRKAMRPSRSAPPWPRRSPATSANSI
ncbi:alpha/beta fold hydrolase [Brevundimonas diminuta]|uniref:alpha/beta fold hydrolase n=1 Tax=Brevundimonas diminuta TaxID=293 RepID=UPI003D9A37BF